MQLYENMGLVRDVMASMQLSMIERFTMHIDVILILLYDLPLEVP